ncbi:hypothetical protein LTR97_009417 [Elasticomyces elasticus]|uniref:F-box domain-containing protein n=1 Tax=Elasticomyces elasticus TaxID=574655 RepID=A0AAN7W6I2_9PEZI|nr:hypothetical protein LTR97_009417 [Elasticomyces elasticus]
MPSLLDLPAELLVAVAAVVAKEDLCAFRLASRDTAAAVHDIWIIGFFAKRTHLATTHGLQILLDITAQQDLAKHVKQIALVVPGLDENKFGGKPEPYERGHSPDALNAWRIMEDALHIVADVNSGEKDLFVQVLDNLRALGVAPLIEVCVSVPEGRISGLTRLLQNIRDKCSTIPVQASDLLCGPCDDVLYSALTAIGRFGKLKALSISAWRGAPFDALDYSGGQFYEVEWLRLNTGPLQMWCTDYGQPRPQYLSLSTNGASLRHLTIDLQTWRWDKQLDRISSELDDLGIELQKCGHEHLTSLRLDSVSATVDTLIAFLTPLAKRLQCLHLVNTIIPADDRYQTLFQWLLNRSSLLELRLRDLSDENGDWLAYLEKKLDCWIRDVKACRASPGSAYLPESLSDDEGPRRKILDASAEYIRKGLTVLLNSHEYFNPREGFFVEDMSTVV